MRRTVVLAGIVVAFVARLSGQESPERRDVPPERPGPRRFESGQLLPPPLVDELRLTREQTQQLAEIQQKLEARLESLLTAEQRRAVADFRPRRPAGPGRPEGDAGPPRYELGQIFPSTLIDELKLTQDQRVQIAEMRAELKPQLESLLNAEQRKSAANFRPRAPGAGEPTGAGRPGRTAELGPDPDEGLRFGPRLVVGGKLKVEGDAKFPFAMAGDAIEGRLGDERRERNGGGVRLLSGQDYDEDGRRAGQLIATVAGVRDEPGRWYRVRLVGLAQEGFAVERDELYLKVEFFKDAGRNSLDFIKKSIYPQVELERKSLADERTNKNLGAATWRNFSIDVRTPFPEVDTLQVSVGFAGGAGSGERAEFWVAEVDVSPIPDPADYRTPVTGTTAQAPPALANLKKLGGRWYYDPAGATERPAQFDATNADRLYYLTDRLETPFVGNMSAWLRRGSLDVDGKTVERDRFVDDSLIVTFTDSHLVMRSKNLPNHPVAVFPDRSRFLDGNPNVIREQRDTWRIPLEPRPNPQRAAAMTQENKRGLPMGPIGVATNGVVFFNPFDHIAEADAVWRLDRCCGHPSPRSVYHYHKYPVCVNTPWADDGTEHSPLIGFAFDGFPVYGPYESAGTLAKDSRENPLNEYNLHEDAARGPHYHVTPGKFPHILGGYWGEAPARGRPPR